jgi:hypothetical protein
MLYLCKCLFCFCYFLYNFSSERYRRLSVHVWRSCSAGIKTALRQLPQFWVKVSSAKSVNIWRSRLKTLCPILLTMFIISVPIYKQNNFPEKLLYIDRVLLTDDMGKFRKQVPNYTASNATRPQYELYNIFKTSACSYRQGGIYV